MAKGKVKFFIDTPGNSHGTATVPGVRKDVFLPTAHMKAVEDGKLRDFRPGEEKRHPLPGSDIVLEFQMMRGAPLATKWGVTP